MLRYGLTIYSRDRDGNNARMSIHTGIIVTPSVLSDEINTLVSRINAISDAIVYQVLITVRYTIAPNDIGTPTELNERSGIFVTQDDDDNIYTVIVPAIAPEMITTTGVLSGVLLTPEAIDYMQAIFDAIPVISNELVAVGGNAMVGSVVM